MSKPIDSNINLSESGAVVADSVSVPVSASIEVALTTQHSPDGFFTLGKRGDRWVLMTPEREPFFSAGLNHIDSSPLRYPENLERWDQRYGNDTVRWVRESVAPNLKSWGFNSVGWVQEVSIIKHAHTPSFTLEEYRALDMPYCHLLPFIETHQWNPWHRNPDLFSRDFEDWCDYVARDQCARLKDEPNLIGYFYSDCPTWVHSRPENEWRGPMFDPDRLESDAGRRELFDLAERYYRVTHDAVRRYDPHHLILGDRYEANAPLPLEIVKAADPYVDVLSFQDFNRPVEQMAAWHEATGKPVLMADGAGLCLRVEDATGRYRCGCYSKVDGAWYAEVVEGLLDSPGVIGAHLCGAYIRNRYRGRGLIDENEQPDTAAVAELRKTHKAVADWIRSFGK